MDIKKRREDLFFGIHFDFHAGPDDEIGTIVDEEGIADLLDRTKPDFVQIDTKGHPGISSYKTKAGTPAKHFHYDTLKMWRKLTKERGIALYGHHSGVFDMTVAQNHPDWAVVTENGETSNRFVSVFSPYAKEILIPQLKELALEYELDGAWIDGENWASYTDYGKYATEAWEKETGTKPPVRGEEGFEKYRYFCRDGFKAYVANYISEIKKVKPDFQITSNWMFSYYMPEKHDVAIDYMSGDYSCSNAVNISRCIARVQASRGLTWDLMSWGQNAIPLSWETRNRTTKGAAQYCQEAATTLSAGGAFQFFNILYGTGGLIQNWAVPTWQKVAEFCRERQDICWKASIVKQIGVIFPEGYDESKEQLYVPEYRVRTFSWTKALQDIQLSTSIIQEFQCAEGGLKDYPVVLAPSGCRYKKETIQALKDYVSAGGKLIIEGQAINFFEETTESKKLIWIDGGDCLAAMETLTYSIDGKDALYYFDNNYYRNEDRHVAAVAQDTGKGKLIKLGVDIGSKYDENNSVALKKFLKNLISMTGFKAIATVSGSQYADITITQKENKLLINLVNMLGAHNTPGVRSFDEIPPLYDLEVSISSDKKPRSVKLSPENTDAEYQYRDGVISVKVPKLEIHSVVVVEY